MTDATTIKDGFKHEAQKLLSELQTLSDEFRVKAHLANAERRDAWNGLQTELEQFEWRAKQVTHDAIGELRLAGQQLKTKLERFHGESPET